MAKNRTMAAKHALARKYAVATSVHNALGESMEDVKAGTIVRPTDGVARYFKMNRIMGERKMLSAMPMCEYNVLYGDCAVC